MSETQPKKPEWHHDAAVKLFDHVESQVRLADQKAGLIFAADSVLLAGYISIVNSDRIMTLQTGIKFAILISGGVSILCVITAIVLVLRSIDPVHKLEQYDQYQVFFKLIADPQHNRSASHYEENFLNLSQSQFTSQVLRSIHGKSDWASKKLTEINKAIRFSIASLAFAAFAGLFAFATRF